MKCEICGIRDASLFVQQVTVKETREMHLCLECAKKRGITPTNPNLELTLDTVIADLMNKLPEFHSENRTCPICGQSEQLIKKEGRAGCPECYTVFKSEVFSALKAKGLGGIYGGKLPKKLPHFRSVLTDRMTYQIRLETAVANEDYETAAVYRDRLKALENCPLGTDYAFGSSNE